MNVFIGTPFYLSVDPRSVLAGTSFASQEIEKTGYHAFGSGFHCHNFNCLWCTAINARKEEGWTHFAMIHQDVVPAHWWVDTLLKEMERVGVDLLSVVIPQKESSGITSTGVLDAKTLQMKRLTMKEAVTLPITFTSSDLGEDKLLLASSGLWICDITKPWVEEVFFRTPSSIVRNSKGELEPRVLSEDWDFSIQLFQRGIKVASTRIVETRHMGGGEFDNKTGWGNWETDENPLDGSWVLGRRQ